MSDGPKRIEITMNNWVQGVNSLLPPATIAPNAYAWGENIVDRGGLPQTRPGKKMWKSIAGSRPQGGCIFKPTNALPMAVIAIDGVIYYANFPKFEFAPIGEFTMSADARIVRFEHCIQTTYLTETGELKVREPLDCLIIQDGISRALFWDGTRLLEMDPGAHQTPSGLWMKWINGRLWVFQGSRGLVSDLGDPTSFTETTYLAERSSFEIGGECTGCIMTADKKGLLAFTKNSTTAFKAYILDRQQWLTTPDFQMEILPNIGCVSGLTPLNQYGCTQWMSQHGWISLDSAFFTERSSKIRTLDGPMMRSKRLLAQNQSGVCATAFENFLLVSVPEGSKHNTATWCMDQAPLEELSDQGLWCSSWTGTRPVCYFNGEIGGKQRCFELCLDETQIDGQHIHMWENFRENRTDQDGRISCQFETGFVTNKDPMRFMYAELELVEIYGTVNVWVYLGGTQGPFYLIAEGVLQAEIGCFGSEQLPWITETAELQNFKKQSRTFLTTDFTPQGKACSPESEQAGIDKGFQLLIQWKGQMGIREVKFVLDPAPGMKMTGECAESEECDHNAIDESGNNIT